MTEITEILNIAARNQKKAHEIIKESGVVEAWQSAGAELNLVGSLKTGLFMKHRDIDFHIYTPNFTAEEGFKAISKLAQNPKIVRVEYNNLADTEEYCYEWHAYYKDDCGDIWQFDMIHILKGSTYDGFFEDIANRISAVLTEETKQTVLKLKYQTPDDMKIMGIEYCHAVIGGGVRTWEEFLQWRKNNPVNGVCQWKP